MKRFGIALAAGLLFAMASQAAPAAAQLELLEGITGGDDAAEDGDALSGLLDSVDPPDSLEVPQAVEDAVDKVTDVVDPDEETPTPPPPPPTDPPDNPVDKGDGESNDNGATPKPRNDGGAPAPAPAPTRVVDDTQSLGSADGPTYRSSRIAVSRPDAVVAGRTIVSDSLDLDSDKAEAQAAANLPLDGGSPFGPVQFLAVVMVAAVMCAEFLYGVRRSTGDVLRA